MFAFKVQFFIMVLLVSQVCHKRNHSYAYINIQIEPEDIQNVGDFIMQFQQQQQQFPQQRNAALISVWKKVSGSILQMMGIMITLVGANVTHKISMELILLQVE